MVIEMKRKINEINTVVVVWIMNHLEQHRYLLCGYSAPCNNSNHWGLRDHFAIPLQFTSDGKWYFPLIQIQIELYSQDFVHAPMDYAIISFATIWWPQIYSPQNFISITFELHVKNYEGKRPRSPPKVVIFTPSNAAYIAIFIKVITVSLNIQIIPQKMDVQCRWVSTRKI